MEREILWYTLGGSPDDASFTANAVTELVRRLSLHLPDSNFRFSELQGETLKLVLPELQSGHLNGAVAAIRSSRTNNKTRARAHVTVYCPDLSHPAVRAARKMLEHAAWGISLAGTLSVSYAPANPYLLWHETLHLLGAQDHYDRTTFRTTCGLPTCIMQYAPSAQTVGANPFLCKPTTTILRTAFA
jgi:hypothetical protein